MTTPQVLITQSTQATVEVSSSEPAVVEVVAPVVPVEVELSVPGPQGPIGPVREPDVIRVDAATSGVIFTGKAQHGSSESSPVWTITRSIYNAAGIRTSKGTAGNVTWTGRAGHTYI